MASMTAGAGSGLSGLSRVMRKLAMLRCFFDWKPCKPVLV